MKRFVLALVCAVLIPSFAQMALAAPAENITLSLPESALAQTVAALVPFSFEANSKLLRGTVHVREVRNIKLATNSLKAKLSLAANNLEIVHELAGQPIRMKVGEVALTPDVTAGLRFDAARQILYIKLLADGAAPTPGNEAAAALSALLNGREFPIEMRDLDPFVADIGGKSVTVATKVAGIRALPGKLELSLAPQISTKAPR
jgi:hypothetical protein